MLMLFIPFDCDNETYYFDLRLKKQYSCSLINYDDGKEKYRFFTLNSKMCVLHIRLPLILLCEPIYVVYF